VSAESQIRDHYDQFTGNSLLKRIVQIDAVAFDGDQNYNRTPVEYMEEREIPELLCQPSPTPDNDLGMGSSINTPPIGSSTPRTSRFSSQNQNYNRTTVEYMEENEIPEIFCQPPLPPDSDLGMGSSINTAPTGSSMPRISRSDSFSNSGSISKAGRLRRVPLERYNQLMRRTPNLNDSLDSIASFRSERLARFVEGMEIRFVDEIAMKGEAFDPDEMINREKNPKNRDKNSKKRDENPKNSSNNVTNTPDETECITLDSD